ncbi:hypothetical protein TRFO_22710 [Tritrichomonas foetus]|uniref:Uncharacterized protein n=1 Tax=Tritrichomonas foetus TaxID=1144522 RepID=A0A1J4KBN8_9EUKA|nr:hypothetical protein TRFO_22710 [Tritrichomonas foetus]|eukprot:OHT08635.1 hypothetical protein TRFO_22710 [Tritrichomonas foetus]
MNRANQISTLTIVSWIAALLSIIVLMIDLFIRLPSPEKTNRNSYQNDVNYEKNPNFNRNQETETENESIPDGCCIATILNSKTIKQGIALGYSLNATNGFRPKSFAILTSSIPESDLSIVKQYFNVIDVTSDLSNHKYEQYFFWSHLKECSPVVAVTPSGVFNKPPTKLCTAKPFSAVSKKGDVVFFDTSLMVLDPNMPPPDPKNTDFKFSKFITRNIEWNPLSTDLSVEDYSNEYIDFWLKYSSPTFIHFDDDTFKKAASGNEKSHGSQGLYAIIKRIILGAKEKHPEIFTD